MRIWKDVEFILLLLGSSMQLVQLMVGSTRVWPERFGTLALVIFYSKPV